MKLLEVEGEGHVLQCPIAGDATGYHE